LHSNDEFPFRIAVVAAGIAVVVDVLTLHQKYLLKDSINSQIFFLYQEFLVVKKLEYPSVKHDEREI
jgi:hypothetical protein